MKFEYTKKVLIGKFEEKFGFLIGSVQEIRLPSGFSNFIFYAISELFINIKEHAQVDKGLIVLKIKNNRCLIKVEDKGIGLKQSYLKRNILAKDDFSAIELALSGLSTKGYQERGFGLYSIKKLVQALNGQLIIKSGLAKVSVGRDKINFYTLGEKFSGTSIEIKTPVSKIDFYRIIT